MNTELHEKNITRSIIVVLFISGFSALLYQVIRIRHIDLITSNAVHAWTSANL